MLYRVVWHDVDWCGMVSGVLVGHVVVFTYHFLRKSYLFGKGLNIQQTEPNFDWKIELM